MSYSSESYYPEFHEPPTYLQPPPPPPSHRREKRLALLLLCGILLIGGSFTAYIVLAHGTIQSVAPTPVLPRPTPTLDAKAALVTNDFARFLQAFTVLLARHDYLTIQTATDTQNFQEIPLRADGIADWNQLYSELTTGALSFTIPTSPLTPDQAGYSCFGYSSSGINYLSIKIDAIQLQYVVGTTHSSQVSSDAPLVTPNGTVFVFELPNEPSPTWLWRAVTFNNSLGCG